MYQAKITSNGNEKYHATTRNASFDMASDGTSSKPTDVLLASLCACLGHYVGEYLHQRKIQFSTYTVSAESRLASDRSRLGDIDVAIGVSGATMNDSTRTGMLEHLVQCHIYGTLKANSNINIQVSVKAGCCC